MNVETPKRTIPWWIKIPIVGITSLVSIATALCICLLLVLQFAPARLTFLLELGAEQILDRKLQIGELERVDLGRNTEITVTSVRLANPDWETRPDLLTVERFFIRLNLPSIWRDGPILIDEVQLTNVNVGLRAPSNHRPNWEFWPPTEPNSELVEEDDDTIPVIVREGLIRNGEITYIDPDQDITVKITRLELTEPQVGEPLTFDLDGAINEIPLQAFGHLGPMSALITLKDLKVELSVIWGEFSLEAQGSIADLIKLSGPDLRLKITSPHSRPLLNVLGIPAADDGHLAFDARITDLEPGIVVAATGTINEIKVAIEAQLLDPLGLDGIDASLILQGPSLAKMGTLLEVDGLPDVPYTLSVDASRHGSLVDLRKGHLTVGQSQLDVAGELPNFPNINDWQVKLNGQHLNTALIGAVLGTTDIPGVLYDIQGELKSAENGVELLRVSVSSLNSTLVLDGTVTDDSDYHGSEVKIRLSGDDLNLFGSSFGVPDLPAGPFTVAGDVKYTKNGWQLTNGRFATAGFQLGLSGNVDQLTPPQNLHTDFRLEIENLADTLKAYELNPGNLPGFPIVMQGTIDGQPDRLNLQDLNITSGSSRLTLSGFLGDLTNPDALDLTISADTPDLLVFLPEIDTNLPSTLPVDFTGSVGLSNNSISVRTLEGQFGELQLALSGRFNTVAPHDNSYIIVDAMTPDLGKVVAPWAEAIPALNTHVQLEASYQSGGVKVEKLDAKVGDAHLVGSLSIGDIKKLASAEAEIRLDGPSSQNLLKFLGVEATFPDEAYSLNVGISNSPDSLNIDPIAIVWAGSDLSGRVTVLPGEIPNVNVVLHSKLLNLSFLLPDIDQLEAQRAALEATGKAENKSEENSNQGLPERVIPDEPINLDWLHSVQASVTYQVDEFILDENKKSSATIDISIKDGELISHRLNIDGTSFIGDVKLIVSALEDTNKFSVFFDMQRIPLLLMMGGEPHYTGDSFYRARLQTEGNSIRELAQHANGTLAFKTSGGYLDNQGLGLIFGDLVGEILSTLNPYSETEKRTHILCSAGAMRIIDGKLNIAPGLVVRTDKMDIAFGGVLNLHDERLDLVFNTQSRKGIGISASKAITPYFKIGGTLSNPLPTVDVKGAAISGGAAVATAGISILAEGLWDRWIGTAKNPCENLLTKASKKDKKIYEHLLEERSP